MSNFHAQTIQSLRSILSSLPGSPPLPSPMTDFYAETLQLLGLIQQTADNLPDLIQQATDNIQIQHLVYTVDQSSVLEPAATFLATYQKLTDGNNTTGASTIVIIPGGDPQWIRADLGQLRNVLSCSVAAGFVGGSGISGPLDNCQIHVSTDNLNWEIVSRITGSTNSDLAGVSQLSTPIVIPVNRRIRYLRLFNSTSNSRAATSELRIRGW